MLPHQTPSHQAAIAAAIHDMRRQAPPNPFPFPHGGDQSQMMPIMPPSNPHLAHLNASVQYHQAQLAMAALHEASMQSQPARNERIVQFGDASRDRHRSFDDMSGQNPFPHGGDPFDRTFRDDRASLHVSDNERVGFDRYQRDSVPPRRVDVGDVRHDRSNATSSIFTAMAAQGAPPVSMQMRAPFQAAPKLGKAAKKAAKKQQQQQQHQAQQSKPQKQQQQHKQGNAHAGQVQPANDRHQQQQFTAKQSNAPAKDVSRSVPQPRSSAPAVADESEEEGEIVDDGAQRECPNRIFALCCRDVLVSPVCLSSLY
jgi:hypothetical protein